jgi:hypothetical protein
MLRTAAGLHSDPARRAIREVFEKHCPLDRFVHDFTAVRVDPMQLDDVFCDVHTDCRMLHFGPSGLPVKIFMIFQFGLFDAVGP